MSTKSRETATTANGPLKSRLLFAASAVTMVLSGCVSADNTHGRSGGPTPLVSNSPQQTPQRQPGEVRLTPDNQTPPPAPVIKKGTGRFVDSAAQTPTGRGNYVVKLVDVEISEAVKQILGDTLGLSYVIEGDLTGTISVQTARPVDQRTLLQMLSGALSSREAALINEGGFYRVAPAEAAATASRVVGYGSSVNDLKVGAGVQVVPLKFISATEMEKILKPIAGEGGIARVDVARNLLILKDDSRNIASMLEMVDLFDVDYMAGMSFALLPVKNTSASGLVSELQQLFGGAKGDPNTASMVRFVPIDRLNSVLAISAQPAQLDRVQEWMTRLDRTGGLSDQSFHVVALQNRPAKEVAALLQRTLSNDVNKTDTSSVGDVRPGMTPVVTQTNEQQPQSPNGVSQDAVSAVSVAATLSPTSKPIRIQADDSNNSLLILSTPEEYQLLQQVVNLLDVSPNQVMLEATIAEVTLTDDLQYGLNWFLESGEFNATFSSADNGAVASVFPGFSAVFDGQDGRAVLSAVASVTDVKVLSSPSLMVLDNRTASLQVGDQVPIITQSSVSTIDPNAPLVNQVELKDTGVILKVTPRVNDGGRVTLEIEQEVSDVIETQTSGIDSPTIQQRKINTTVAVDDGSTVALGGLIRDRVTDGHSKVPLLGDIPGVGELFRSTSKKNERTELVILITPRVVTGNDDAVRITRELRDQMLGVEAAMSDAAKRSNARD